MIHSVFLFWSLKNSSNIVAGINSETFLLLDCERSIEYPAFAVNAHTPSTQSIGGGPCSQLPHKCMSVSSLMNKTLPNLFLHPLSHQEFSRSTFICRFLFYAGCHELGVTSRLGTMVVSSPQTSLLKLISNLVQSHRKYLSTRLNPRHGSTTAVLLTAT